jgi:hypothetical protein
MAFCRDPLEPRNSVLTEAWVTEAWGWAAATGVLWGLS